MLHRIPFHTPEVAHDTHSKAARLGHSCISAALSRPRGVCCPPNSPKGRTALVDRRLAGKGNVYPELEIAGPPSFIVSDDDTRERIVTLCRLMEPFRPKTRALEPSHGPSKERAGRPTYVSFGDMRRKDTKDGCRIMILNIYDHLAFDHPYRDRPVVELTVYGRGDRGDITENVWYYTIPADDYAELCNILESYSGELASADRS